MVEYLEWAACTFAVMFFSNQLLNFQVWQYHVCFHSQEQL